ncbi:MAG TPA: hypothetical protein VMG38_18320 [Trebonia sp.]|nr:hypothetical protein [Trebonia sp.]
MHSAHRAPSRPRLLPGAAGGQEPAAGGPGAAAQPPARRWWAVAGWTVACLAVFAFFLQVSYGGRIDSDGANSALQAWDLIHGHLLLRGWDFGDATFYTFELPVNGITQLIFGLGPRAAHVASALVYTIIAGGAVALAVGGAAGAARAARGCVVVGIMAVPLLTIATTYTLVEEPDHPGTSVFLLVSALLIDQAGGRLQGRRWVAPLVCLILAAGQLGDATVLYVGVPAVVLACGYRMLAQRRLRCADGAMVVAAVVSVPLELAVRAIIKHLGGYQEVTPKTTLASPGQWPHNVVVTVGVLRSLYGATVTSQTRLGVVAAALGTLGLLAAAAGIVLILVRWRKSSRAEHLLVLVIVLNLGVYLVSKGAQGDGYREVAAVLPCGAALAARTVVPPAFLVARRAVAVAVVAGLVALVPLSGAATRAHVGPALGPAPGDGATAPTAPLTAWLEAHHVSYALAGYWSASIVTLQSGDRVQVRAVTLVPRADGTGYHIHVPYWETNSQWYDPARHDPRYVIAQLSGPSSVHTYERFFGKPMATYQVPGFVVLEYPQNLLRRVLPMLGIGVGPKS